MPRPGEYLPDASEGVTRVEDLLPKLRQLCNSGQIRAVKGDDKTWRIPADEVARLEENGAPSLPKNVFGKVLRNWKKAGK